MMAGDQLGVRYKLKDVVIYFFWVHELFNP